MPPGGPSSPVTSVVGMRTRHLLESDLDSAARCLAEAFAEDPVNRWLTGDYSGDDRLERSAEGFYGPIVRAGLLRGHSYGLAGAEAVQAVAVWSPPDVEVLDEAGGMALGTAFAGAYGDESVGRLLALDELTRTNHPSESHFYLFALGSAVPGGGRGGRVLEPVLDRCDADVLPAYLESSNPATSASTSVRASRRGGRTVSTATGPSSPGMWRDPR